MVVIEGEGEVVGTNPETLVGRGPALAVGGLLRYSNMFRPVYSYLPTLIPKMLRPSQQPYTRHNHLRFPKAANRRPQLSYFLIQSLIPFFQQ